MPRAEATAEVVASLLREYRRQIGISQERLAHLAEVDRTYVGKVERGTMNPTIYRMNRLLSAAGIAWRDFGDALDTRLAERPPHSPGRHSDGAR